MGKPPPKTEGNPRNYKLSVGERVSDKDETRCGVITERCEALFTVLWEDGETSRHTEAVLLPMPSEADIWGPLTASIRAGWSEQREWTARVVKDKPAELPEWTEFLPHVMESRSEIW